MKQWGQCPRQEFIFLNLFSAKASDCSEEAHLSDRVYCFIHWLLIDVNVNLICIIIFISVSSMLIFLNTWRNGLARLAYRINHNMWAQRPYEMSLKYVDIVENEFVTQNLWHEMWSLSV